MKHLVPFDHAVSVCYFLVGTFTVESLKCGPPAIYDRNFAIQGKYCFFPPLLCVITHKMLVLVCCINAKWAFFRCLKGNCLFGLDREGGRKLN